MTTVDGPRARVALITHPEAKADEFARLLVSRGVAACVNLLAVRSVYHWQGETHDDPEVLLVVKTTDERVEEIEMVLKDEHPYDVPELVVLEPAHVEASYLAWLLEETAPTRKGD